MRFAAENRGKVEPETVDLHLGDPVSQAVGDHLQHARMGQIERIACAGIVDVIARLVWHQAIVGRVIDAFEGNRRATFVAFGGVVVDHVENDFEVGVMKAVHHFLEFADRVDRRREETRVGREEANCVVAPIVGEPFVEQMAVVDEGLNRHQLDRRDAKALDVIEHGLLAESCEGATQIFRYVGMSFGKTAHVGFIEDHALPGQRIAFRMTPRKIGVDHLAFRHEGRAVALVEGQIAVFRIERIAEDFRRPLKLADMRFGVGIEQEFVRIETMAFFRFIRAVHPIAVHRTGFEIRQEHVPDLVGVLRQLDAFDLRLAGFIEQTQFDPGCMR